MDKHVQVVNEYIPIMKRDKHAPVINQKEYIGTGN